MGMNRLAKLQGRMIATRYGNPGRSLAIVLVVGAYGKTTTAKLVAAILERGGRKTAAITNDMSEYTPTIDGIQNALYRAKKAGKTQVVLEATPELIRSGALASLVVDTLIMTSDFAERDDVLEVVPRHVIAPEDVNIPSGLVEAYKRISFGEEETAEAAITHVKLFKKGTEVQLTIDHQTKLELATFLCGKANSFNVTAAAAAGYVLAVDLEAIRDGVADIEHIDGNFVTLSDQPYRLITDRAPTRLSVEFAISSAKQLAERRVLVAFGDAAVDSETIELAKDRADRVYALETVIDASSGVETTATADDMYDKILRGAKQGDVVLLLGRSLESIKRPDAKAEAL